MGSLKKTFGIMRVRRWILTSPLSHLGNRSLADNQLTSLGMGIFDKNTALTGLYVDGA